MRIRVVAACLVLFGILLVPLSAGAQDGNDFLPFASGLERPRGLTFDADGHLVATMAGSGDTYGDGRIAYFRDLDGDGMATGAGEIKNLVSNLSTYHFLLEPFGGSIFGPSDAQVTADGEVYFVTNAFAPDVIRDGWGAVWSTAAPNDSTNPLQNAAPYAHLWPHELANNPDGDIYDTNPYGLVLDSENNAYVTEAAMNAVLFVTPEGEISIYAVFEKLANTRDFGPETMHAVPTGIAWGPDGALYVGFETGFPWPEGASSVIRLEDLNDDGDALDDGESTVYATGLTTVTDIAFDNEGRLLATEFRFVLTGEEMASGRLMRWDDGEWEVLADGLSTPTGVAAAPDGTIYVTMEYAGQIVQVRGQ